jgi:hypothetical protein
MQVLLIVFLVLVVLAYIWIFSNYELFSEYGGPRNWCKFLKEDPEDYEGRSTKWLIAKYLRENVSKRPGLSLCAINSWDIQHGYDFPWMSRRFSAMLTLVDDESGRFTTIKILPARFSVVGNKIVMFDSLNSKTVTEDIYKI